MKRLLYATVATVALTAPAMAKQHLSRANGLISIANLIIYSQECKSPFSKEHIANLNTQISINAGLNQKDWKKIDAQVKYAHKRIKHSHIAVNFCSHMTKILQDLENAPVSTEVATIEIVQMKKSPYVSVTINGMIGNGDGERFKNVLKKIDKNSQRLYSVRLTSPGGSIQDAASIGNEIRRRGAITKAVRECDSACPYIWIAGVWRYTDVPLGTHGAYDINKRPVDPATLEANRDYWVHMEMPQSLYDLSIKYKPTEMYYIPVAEAKKYEFTSVGQQLVNIECPNNPNGDQCVANAAYKLQTAMEMVIKAASR